MFDLTDMTPACLVISVPLLGRILKLHLRVFSLLESVHHLQDVVHMSRPSASGVCIYCGKVSLSKRGYTKIQFHGTEFD